MKTLQQIQEEGDDAGVDEVGKHSADDGDDEEGLDRIAVFIAYGTHVSHCVRGCTKTETAYSCTQDGGIVVATQQWKGYEVGIEGHHGHL